MKPSAIFLMGPTAAGKTAAAVALTKALPLEIISVDSAMVYREMDIGSAKPAPDILKDTPHRLIDFLDPGESYSAARFREDALREMADICGQGKVPLLAGGSMLYFRALEHGLADMPKADVELRAMLDERRQKEGLGALHATLAEVDPAAAQRISVNDPQRIQRALEVFMLTGKSITEHHDSRSKPPLPYRLLKLALAPADRSRLHDRIEKRFTSMLEEGLLAEVEALYRRGDLTAAKPAVRAVGYRQLWEYLEGKTGLEEAGRRAVVATRRFAKRQLTWLRAETGVEWFDSEDPEVLTKLQHRAEEFLRLE
ncbi:MAG: tRNA (adenosine(37)-N6)-dimethylallyltransferase MiaA [Gammaproteobacteria bacterium]|nr:tRNA (adenosine(37)-N6)-dimethylallyltransferase MiaA [Gammaproteobacteria bacterium]